MTTPANTPHDNDHMEPRRITEEDLPQFPCWLWNTHLKDYQQWTAEPLSVRERGWSKSELYSHWLPNQPEPPTCVPDTKHFPSSQSSGPGLPGSPTGASDRAWAGENPADGPISPTPTDPAMALVNALLDMIEPEDTGSEIVLNINRKKAATLVRQHYATPPASAPASGETPRTDACLKYDLVPASLARRLQDELNEAKAKLAEVEAVLRQRNDEYCETLTSAVKIETERNALRSRLALADELAKMAEKVAGGDLDEMWLSKEGRALRSALTRYHAAKEGQQ